MRQANSGTTLPVATHTWAIANQALATNTAYAPAHIAMQGARVNTGLVVATCRTAMPRTAGGCDPTVTAYCDADDFVTLVVSNNNANALVALAADAIFNLLWLPVAP